MRVPVYDAPQVATAALPEVRSRLDMRTGLDAVGQGVAQAGQGLQRAVDAVEREHRIVAEKAAAGASSDAENGLANEALTELHGSPDGSKRGYFQLQGKDAFAQSAAVQERLQQLQQKYAAKLAPAAKALFLPRSNAMLLSWRKSVETYAGAQNDAANLAAAKALGETAARIAFLQYADDQTVKTASAAAETALAAQLHGMPPEVVQAELNQQRQHVAVARVKAAIAAGDLPAAERLLRPEQPPGPVTKEQQADAAERIRQRLQAGAAGEPAPAEEEAGPVKPGAISPVFGAAGPALERAVGELRDQVLARKNALTAVEASRNEGGLHDEARLQQIYDATAPEAKTEAFDREFQAQRARALALDKGTKGQAFWQAVGQWQDAGQNLNAVSPTLRTWLKTYDREGWVRLTKMDQDWQAGHRGGAEKNPAQQAAYAAFLVDREDHPEKYANMPIEQFARTWYPLLSPQDRAKAGEKLAESHHRAGQPEKLGGIEEKMLLQIGRENGAFPKESDVSKWNDSQFRAYYRAHQALSDRVNAEKQRTGKAPPPDQVQAWAQALFLKGTVPESGIIFEDHTTRVEAAAEGKPFAPKWTDDQVEGAKRALTAAGARVNDASVEAYLRRKYELPAAPISAAAPAPAGQSEPTTTSSIPVSMRTNGR